MDRIGGMDGTERPDGQDGVGVTRMPPSRSALALAVTASLLAIPQALLLGDAVATVAIGPDAGMTGLLGWPLWLALFCVGVMRAVAEAAAAYRGGLRAVAAKVALRRTLVGTFATWSPLAPSRPATGDVVSTLVERADALDPWFVRYPIARLRMTVVPVVVLVAVAPISWVVALLLLLAGPFIPIFMSLIGARAREISRRQLDEAGTLTSLLLDRVGGLATIRSLEAADRVADDIAARGDLLRARTMEVLAVAFLSSAALEFFASVGVAITAVYIGFHLMGLIDFGGGFGLAGGVAMLALAPEFFQPLRDFAAAYHDRADALAFDERAAAGFRRETPRARLRSAAPRPLARGGLPPPAIEIAALSVRMPGRADPVLDDVTLTAPAGVMTAVTGRSGIGKSTLLACVGGLLDGYSGTVRLGGVDGASEQRPPVAWLSQEPRIRHGSVLANLSPDGRRIEPAEAWRALRSVGLETAVRRMPRGLLTPLGETGAGLSRGELRRLTVARVLLDEAPVVLADEPTADLDDETAAVIRDTLLALSGARTVLVATHDERLAASAAVRIDLGAVPA